VQANILGTVVQGLGANAYFVYAGTLGSKKDKMPSSALGAPATYVNEVNSTIAWEVGLGLSYEIDSFTTFSMDFAMAKWGKAERNAALNFATYDL